MKKDSAFFFIINHYDPTCTHDTSEDTVMCIILVEGLYFNYGTRARSPFLGGGTRKVGHENLISLIAAAAVHSGTLFFTNAEYPMQNHCPPLMPKPIHCNRKTNELSSSGG